MLRLRFSSGLILGLVVGVLAGVPIGMLMLPARTGESSAATSLQVIELTRKLEAAKEDKERTERQLEQFQKLADQMTATFKSLELRFNALEEAQRLREAPHPSAAQPETKSQPPLPATPTPVPPSVGAAAPVPADGAE